MNTTAWHALIALGTEGGDQLVDGDRLARGAHLRWSWRPSLGFPAGGYDVWRREHRPPVWWCLETETHMAIPADGRGEWEVQGFRLAANDGPVQHQRNGCGKRYAVVLPAVAPDPASGEARLRSLVIWSPVVAAAVRVRGLGDVPEVEVLAAGPVVVARQRAREDDGGAWSLEIWADGIIGVRLRAASLRLCAACFGEPHAPDGWTRLTDQPMLLPVVDPRSANLPEHIHERRETRRIAERRLSSTLADDDRRRLADGFAAEARELTELLLRDGRGARLPEDPSASASARTAPRVGLRAADTLALASLDADVARMLGLYWHDDVDTGVWDYKVVAHHGAVRYPSRLVTFRDLAVGPIASPKLSLDTLTFLSSGGLEVRRGTGATRLLHVGAPRATTVAAVTLRHPAPAVTLRFGDDVGGTFTAWRRRARVGSAISLGGRVTLEHDHGIDAITWNVGADLASVELFDAAGLVGDLTAYAWHVAPHRPAPVHAMTVTDARGASEPVRLTLDGRIDSPSVIVGLDWDAGNDVRDVGTVTRVLVARSARGDGATPRPDGAFELCNADRPATESASTTGRRSRDVGPDVPDRWIARGVGAGWSAWRVRGIDVFGRLGAWSPGRLVEARPSAVPPPPEGVTARYLDPADPLLSAEDAALVAADGAGVLVEWTWPAERRLRAPLVERQGEFRIYLRRGEPNLLTGEVLTVTDLGDRSRLDTNLRIPAPPQGLVGQRLRVGRTSFPITANDAGPSAWIEVAHLTAPAERPGTGPCVIRVTDASAQYVDPLDPLSYDLRLHVHAVGPLASVTARVVAVTVLDGTAHVSLGAPLPGLGGDQLPGLFVSRGLVFAVLEHAAGSPLVEVRGVAQPDGSVAYPAAGDDGTVWTGARYRAWIPGVDLAPRVSEAMATGLVAVTTSDGDPEVGDHPQWSDGRHGSLGNRRGRESRTSRVAHVRVPHRSAPPSVAVDRPPLVDGDVPAVFAEPADWFGRAHYTLAFPPVADATGYRVLRASTEALFTHDRSLRQTGRAPYASGPFTPGDGSDGWLAEHYPDLAAADLTADLTSDPRAARLIEAWRQWSAWYYPRLSNAQVMDLADLDGNRGAFQPAHPGTIPAPPYRDTIDGRGLGRFVYRVRAVDASGNAADWSATFPIVVLRDVTPPKTPTIVKALAADNAAGLQWLAGHDADLAEYRVWRADAAATLGDVRRLPPIAVVPAPAGAATASHVDRGLRGLTTHYYRVAAVDVAGNVSAPTPVVAVRVPDTTPPASPAWERAEWVQLDPAALPPGDSRRARAAARVPAVALQWLADEPDLIAAVERRIGTERAWRTIASGLDPIDPRDPASTAARRFRYADPTAVVGLRAEYRVRLTDPAGNVNYRDRLAIVVKPPRLGGA